MIQTADIVPGIAGYVAILRRRLVYVATIGPFVTLLAITLAFAITPQYMSTATILLETSSINKNVVATTVISYANDQIEIVQGRVMTPAILAELVRSFDPYPGANLSVQAKAQRVLEDTSVERVDAVTQKPLQESNAFALHYRNSDPERAAAVASRLAQLFLTYNQRTRSQAAQEAEAFLAKQAEGVNQQMRALDEELKHFKALHGDALPEYVMRNEASIDRNQHDLESLQQEILRAEEKESLLSLQLSQTSPNMITQSGDLTDLATVRAKLAEAEQRYTPDHPEVKRLKRALETLMGQTSGASRTALVAEANNPQYRTIASQLDSARRLLAGLRGQAGRIRAQMNSYEEMLRKTPGVEREYSDIMRRRQSLQTNYQQIQDKLQNAQLAQNFENEEGGEKFTLVRAPTPSSSPVYPNRIGLILLGLVLGAGLSAAAVAIAENSDLTIRGSSDFPEIADAPLIGSIPRIYNSGDLYARRVALRYWAVAYAVAVFITGAAIITARFK